MHTVVLILFEVLIILFCRRIELAILLFLEIVLEYLTISFSQARITPFVSEKCLDVIWTHKELEFLSTDTFNLDIVNCSE